MTTPNTEAGWRDIASAPKDGTRFLGALTVRNGLTGFEYWQIDIISIDDETGQIFDADYVGWDLEDYTHWHALPAPPHSGDL